MTFFNIFSKEKINEVKHKILVDNGEKNSLVISNLLSLDIELEFQNLPVGDYIVNDLIIERKSINDLNSSIINKRIIHQINEMQKYDKKLLIIEGLNSENIYSGRVHENAVRGMILSIIIEKNIPIIFTYDEKDTAKYISVLVKKGPKREISLKERKNFNNKEEQIRYILESFPGIGPVTSKKLIERFGSIKKIVNAEQKELETVLKRNTEKFKTLTE